jgi:hypothetical protein
LFKLKYNNNFNLTPRTLKNGKREHVLRNV